VQHKIYPQVIHTKHNILLNNLWAICGSSVDSFVESRIVNSALRYMPSIMGQDLVF
jgi:hypothetical protein